MQFHLVVREIRWQMRLSQAELAQIIGCGTRTISAYERRYRSPSFDILMSFNELIKKHKLKIDITLD